MRPKHHQVELSDTRPSSPKQWWNSSHNMPQADIQVDSKQICSQKNVGLALRACVCAQIHLHALAHGVYFCRHFWAFKVVNKIQINPNGKTHPEIPTSHTINRSLKKLYTSGGMKTLENIKSVSSLKFSNYLSKSHHKDEINKVWSPITKKPCPVAQLSMYGHIQIYPLKMRLQISIRALNFKNF